MQRGQFVKKKFKDVQMEILGQVRLIPEVELTLNCNGTVTMSFDEYNRIANDIHEAKMRQIKIERKRKRQLLNDEDPIQ